MVDRSMRQNPVSQVEDVAGTAAGLLQDPPSLSLDLGDWAEEDCRIQITLYCNSWSKSLPRSVQIDTPVQADHCTASLALKFQERGGLGPKMDHGNCVIEQGEQLGHVGLDEPP